MCFLAFSMTCSRAGLELGQGAFSLRGRAGYPRIEDLGLGHEAGARGVAEILQFRGGGAHRVGTHPGVYHRDRGPAIAVAE